MFLDLRNFKITHIGGIPFGSKYQRPRNRMAKGGTFHERKAKRIERNETANTHTSG